MALGQMQSSKAKWADGQVAMEADLPEAQIQTPTDAISQIMSAVDELAPKLTIEAVGHRIVHGGLEFDRPIELTNSVIEKLANLAPFAPLHQPHNLACVEASRKRFPSAQQIGCFDTAFHRSHPWVNDTFAPASCAL